MNLDNHLLYIDITNKCNLNCEFCMYKEERKTNPLDIQLNTLAKTNISNILNHSKTERLIISGEGEPFNNLNSIFDIINLSKGNKKIQIITNGLWLIPKNSNKILKKLESIKRTKNDEYQIRISCDTFHIEKIGESNYKKIIDNILNYNKNDGKIEICFRGIFEEKKKILSMMKNKFLDKGNKIEFKNISELETNIVINSNLKLNFIFKNLIDLDNIKKENSLDKYIFSLESIYNKSFTLGHLKKDNNGLDITIKPNGNLYFYGAEICHIFNICKDKVTIENLQKTIENNFILKNLYTTPFRKLIKSLKKYKPFEEIINSINNPYWVVKKMYSFNKNKFEDLIKC